MDLWSLISLQITLFILMMVGALLKKTGVIGAEGRTKKMVGMPTLPDSP